MTAREKLFAGLAGASLVASAWAIVTVVSRPKSTMDAREVSRSEDKGRSAHAAARTSKLFPDGASVRDLERRLTALEDSEPQSPRVAGGGAGGSLASEDGSAPDFEEERRIEEAAWDARSAEFTEEPRDPSWADNAEQELQVGLGSLVAGATLKSVECKSEQCWARLAWPKGTDVEDASMFTLHRSHKAMNCARHMRVDDVGETDLVFDCR